MHRAECCPWCGTRTLVRDGFVRSEHTSYSCVSYICVLCNTGFSLRNSPRADFVNRMYAAERSQRPPEDEHRLKPGSPPLSSRTLFELQRLEELLLAKSPASRASREANERHLSYVRAELRRRERSQHLTFKLAEICSIDTPQNSS